jgi:DNA-3-methyladenine glycosylase
MILPRKFYDGDTIALAKALIGTHLVHDSKQGRTVGRITETEAYLSKDDAACHAARGKTERNAVMFGPPGHAYVYLIYGMYECFNIVTERVGCGEAVLIRALEPIEGIELMQRRRKTKDIHNLCSGPGKLVMAMGISRKLNGVPLTKGALTLWSRDSFGGASDTPEIVTTKRIGINVSAHLPLRFYEKGSHFASRRCNFAKGGPSR